MPKMLTCFGNFSPQPSAVNLKYIVVVSDDTTPQTIRGITRWISMFRSWH